MLLLIDVYPSSVAEQGVGLGGGGQGIVVVTVSLTVPLTSSLVGRSSLRTILWLLERRTMNLTRTWSKCLEYGCINRQQYCKDRRAVSLHSLMNPEEKTRKWYTSVLPRTRQMPIRCFSWFSTQMLPWSKRFSPSRRCRRREREVAFGFASLVHAFGVSQICDVQIVIHREVWGFGWDYTQREVCVRFWVNFYMDRSLC